MGNFQYRPRQTRKIESSTATCIDCGWHDVGSVLQPGVGRATLVARKARQHVRDTGHVISVVHTTSLRMEPVAPKG